MRGAGRLQEVEGRLLARVEEEEVGDEAGADPDLVSEFSRGLYRVTHLLADWVGLTWIWDVPLSCLGSTAAVEQPNSLWNIPNPSHP